MDVDARVGGLSAEIAVGTLGVIYMMCISVQMDTVHCAGQPFLWDLCVASLVPKLSLVANLYT